MWKEREKKGENRNQKKKKKKKKKRKRRTSDLLPIRPESGPFLDPGAATQPSMARPPLLSLGPTSLFSYFFHSQFFLYATILHASTLFCHPRCCISRLLSFFFLSVSLSLSLSLSVSPSPRNISSALLSSNTGAFLSFSSHLSHQPNKFDGILQIKHSQTLIAFG